MITTKNNTPAPAGEDAALWFANTLRARAPAPREEVTCTHCQLAVPAGLIEPGAEHQFCCNGCKAVWNLLNTHGLQSFYTLCTQLNSTPYRAGGSDDDFSEFDDPIFGDRHIRALGVNLVEARLLLEGIHCAACIWLIEKLPQLVPGVIEARAQLVGGTVTLRWNPQLIKLSAIARHVSQLGYRPYPLTDETQDELSRRETRRQLLRIAIAGACAGNGMLIAFALYGSLFAAMAAEHVTLLRYASAAVGLLALAWPGATFFTGAWQALKTRTPHMDVTLALGLTAGGVMGAVNTLRGAGEIYFDSLGMLVFVLLIGRFLQYRQQRRAAQSVVLLRSLTPRSAHRVNADGTVQRVPLEALRENDLVEVRAGDLVPADGIIASGASTLDQSLLTGESRGLPVQAGDAITAGATNHGAVLRVRVTAVGRATRIGRLLDLVETTSQARVPIVALANRVAGYFLYLILALAVTTLCLWWGRSPDLALEHTIALLVVACPCALGLATPLTIAVAQGRAARQSILIRNGEVFELLARPGMLWLDKTGTVTEGKLTLRAWYGDDSVMPHVLALEHGIVHPLADCLINGLRGQLGTAPLPRVDDQRFEPGRGVRGTIDGRSYLIGTRQFLVENGCDLRAEADWPVTHVLNAGWTPIYVAAAHRLVALAVVGDRLREDSQRALLLLRAAGWQLGLLSGDHPAIVAQVATSLGIPPERARGGVLPEDKLALVRAAAAGHPVVMVGDGVNDAAALAAASVGVAVLGGAEASLHAAHVYLGRPGLIPLVELVQGSRRALRAIRVGLAVSLAYNLSAVTLAVFGAITPLVAAVLMPISSLTVTFLAVAQPSFRSES
jgi:Cu2+-exporting ATPase